MLSKFVPADRVASYHACPHKNRIDLIGQRLVEQRYLPVVLAQHVCDVDGCLKGRKVGRKA